MTPLTGAAGAADRVSRREGYHLRARRARAPRHLVALLPCLLAVSAAGQARERPTLQEWLSEPLSWRGDVEEGAPIELVNEHGDLRLRGKPIEEMEIVGYAQHHVEDERPIRVEPVRDGGGWRLEVTMGEAPEGEEAPESWSGRRVDLTVYVPWTSPLVVRTADGVLEALDLRAPLSAESDSGDLSAGSSRDLTIRTRSGPVRALLEEPGWSSTATIETFSGPVTLWARPDADAAVTLATRGTLTTDFSLGIARVDDTLRRARAVLGTGTGTVTLTSYQAPLALRELVPAEVRRAAPGDAD